MLRQSPRSRVQLAHDESDTSSDSRVATTHRGATFAARARAVALALGCASTAPLAAEELVVTQIGFYFSPRIVVVHPGDTVRWRWSDGTHTVTEGTDGQINGNEVFHSFLNASTPSYSFTFTPTVLANFPRPGGRYDYFCQPHFHFGMNGIVVVAENPPGTVICSGDGSATPCPCGNAASAPTGCVNSSGVGARLRAFGNASVSADTLTLSATGAWEGADLIFFQGSTALAGGNGAVFGAGLRCVGGSVVRLGTKSCSFGNALWPLSATPLSIAGHVQPGSTVHYQAWFQDFAGTCSNYNLTNAYSVVWTP